MPKGRGRESAHGCYTVTCQSDTFHFVLRAKCTTYSYLDTPIAVSFIVILSVIMNGSSAMILECILWKKKITGTLVMFCRVIAMASARRDISTYIYPSLYRS